MSDAHDPNHLPGGLYSIDLNDVLKRVTYDEANIKLQPIRVLGVLGHPEITEEQANCDHEWVTWTGLKGTITDCTKCKREQK